MGLDIWKGQTVETKYRPGALLKMNEDGSITKAAIEEGISLTQFLEREDPTREWKDDPEYSRIDAFGRMINAAGLRTFTDPVAGVYADEFGKMPKGMVGEWIARRWREARYGRPVSPQNAVRNLYGRSILTSADEGLGTIWRPYVDAAQERYTQVSAPIPLSTLVAVETGINSRTYRSAYVTDPTAEQLRMYRVAETTEIPLAKIATGQNTITLYKYGRGFMVSYEQMREAPIDKVAYWVQRAAIQEESDKVEHALDVLVNGDGNANSATSYNLTTLDAAAVAGTITPRGWLAFKAQFGNAYMLDVAFAREADWLDMNMLQFGNSNSFFADRQNWGSFRNLNQSLDASVGLGLTSMVAADKVVGVDTRFALEHVFQIGASIKESQAFITNQTEVMVMSEIEGFSILDQKATRVLNIAA